MKKLIGKINKFMEDDPEFFLIICMPLIGMFAILCALLVILVLS